MLNKVNNSTLRYVIYMSYSLGNTTRAEFDYGAV